MLQRFSFSRPNEQARREYIFGASMERQEFSKDAPVAQSGAECPSDALWMALSEGRLSAEEEAVLHRHIDACADCRALFVALLGSRQTDPPPLPPWELATTFAPPPQFDQYRLVRLLGKGAMGQVYLGHDTFLDRAVAVKFIGTREPGPAERERFLLEARALARLQHPNVVAVYRVGEVAGHPFLVSELVEGRSLEQVRKPLPFSEVLHIAAGLGRGLAALHRRGVLHRDIKPANAVLGNNGEPKLIDLGLAKLDGREISHDDREPSRPDHTEASLTAPRALIGTPRYMPPELWRGEPATPRSDVYSLGVLLFELCTGRFPHTAASVPELRRAVMSQDAPPLRSLCAELAPRLAMLIDRCLSRRAEERPADGEMLSRELERLQRDLYSAPLPAGNPYRGLAAFDAEHRALFFGRERECQDVLELLREVPLVVVAGDSGVGKSSLCQAAVLTRIEEGALGEGRRWGVVRMVPGRSPLSALRYALSPILQDLPADFTHWLSTDPAALALALHQKLGNDRGLTLLVNQLEELVTQASAEEAQRFGAVFGHLCSRVPGLRLLGTLRGDFITQTAALLSVDLPRSLYLLDPLSEEGLREAIIGPAEQKGVRFASPELLTALVSATRGTKSALPLLQFALAELWEARDRQSQSIPYEALASIGGVAGALARHGDGVLARLLPAHRRAARRVLLRLLTPEGLRARRSDAELLANEDDRAVLEALIAGRLVSGHDAGEGASYEVAHEALITGWPTLKGWLDEDGDRRVAGQRLGAAAAEWQRLGQKREGLWEIGQLREAAAAGIDAHELPRRERQFLAASRRSVARRRGIQAGLLIAGPLLIGGLLLGLSIKARRDLDERVALHVAEGRAAQAQARAQTQMLRELRQDAFAHFDRQSLDAAERRWTEVVQATERAARTYAQAGSALERALAVDGRPAAARRLVLESALATVGVPSRAALPDEARRMLASSLFEAALLYEEANLLSRRDELMQRLAAYDRDGTLRQRLQQPATVKLAIEPPSATIKVQRYAPDGRRQLSSAIAQAQGAGELQLAAGSYLLTLTAPERVTVRYPILLGRAEHFVLRVSLPRRVHIPAEYVYVPPGRFLFGSADDETMRRTMLKAQPQHQVFTRGYLIGKYEVTFGDYITYLRALPPAERARRRPVAGNSQLSGRIELRELPQGNFELVLQPSDRRYVVRQGERLRYPGRTLRAEQDWLRFPVSGVSFHDAAAYAAWLAQSERLPGARLCTEVEWERAARGADGRRYSGGDELLADDANIDETYGRNPLSFGPDEIGSHPASESPFAVADMTGNAWEWTRAISPAPKIRGGGWYQTRLDALATNQEPAEETLRSLVIGFRLCADFPVAESSDK